MREMRHTDVEVANPSTAQQRIEAAQRQADSEVADDEEVVDLRVGDQGTRMGDDSRMWWPVTYAAVRKPVQEGSIADQR